MIHSFSSTATAAAAATVVETVGESDISSLSPQGRKMQYYRYNNTLLSELIHDRSVVGGINLVL